MSATAAHSSEDFAPLLAAARGGSSAALGQLFEACRPYLLLVANQVVPDDLKGKLGGSDLVQQTFLEAQRHFDQFHGHTEEQLLAWLREILRNDAINLVRQYRNTAKRQVSREIPLDEALPRAEAPGQSTEPSPSSVVARREHQDLLRQALERLPEHYRQVIQWRNFECLSFEEIGRRLQRSPEAARKLWGRALQQLQGELESPHDSD